MTPARWGVVTAAALAMLLGWWRFWFLCDDAYIAFRYVSNAMAGHGWVWNPPPFQPVEGYSSFAWVLLLDLAWRVGGVEPPRASNALALIFASASLALVAREAVVRPLPEPLEGVRTPWLALILGATVTNRTWLTWASSGLETSLWTFALISWVFLGRAAADARRTTWWMVVAAAMPLIRPDGLLFAAATAAIALASHRRPLVLAPLVLPLVHLVWRWWTYGAWLPNTFAAKVNAPWPEMGARYLASFALEYGFVWWLPIAFMGVAATARLDRAAAVWAVLGAHTAWYLAAVGGDHFEYRILVHWIPLAWLALPTWLAALAPATRAERALPLAPSASPPSRVGGTAGVPRLLVGPRAGVALGAALLLLGLPIPWVHWWQTLPLVEGSVKARQFVAIEQHFPAWARPFAASFDHLQAELIRSWACLRWHSHANYSREQRAVFGSREEGAKISGEGWPVYARNGVGYPAWVMPTVAIIDKKGLNDRVVARTPPLEHKKRIMAHEHRPPPGYVQCFAPNVRAVNGTIRVVERTEPFGPAQIVACEERFARALGEPQQDPPGE